jgi:hypothetical protein
MNYHFVILLIACQLRLASIGSRLTVELSCRQVVRCERAYVQYNTTQHCSTQLGKAVKCSELRNWANSFELSRALRYKTRFI